MTGAFWNQVLDGLDGLHRLDVAQAEVWASGVRASTDSLDRPIDRHPPLWFGSIGTARPVGARLVASAFAAATAGWAEWSTSPWS